MISPDVKEWIRCIDGAAALQRWKEASRPVYVWGAYAKGWQVYEALRERGYEVGGFIDAHKGTREYHGKDVCHPDEVMGRDIFVVVAVEGIRGEIQRYLAEYGFQRDEDYLYFAELIPEVRIAGFRGEYRDAYQNVFAYTGGHDLEINIVCTGGHNTVRIGKDYRGNGRLKLILAYGSTIVLGDAFRSEGDVLLDAAGGGRIVIGKGFFAMKDTNINARYESSIEIVDYVTAGQRLFLSSGRFSPVTIGNDCMFSHDVSIFGTDGHSILDMDERKNRSMEVEKAIHIGTHVWLGKGASVLYGTDIGNGCVVGASSVVRGAFPARCVLAGNRAKVIRENCTWDRRREIAFEDF